MQFPLYIGFWYPHPPIKNQVFQWTPQMLKFFVVNPKLMSWLMSCQASPPFVFENLLGGSTPQIG